MKNPSIGTRMSLPAMVQALSNYIHYFQIFSLAHNRKKVQVDGAFAIMREKSDRRSTWNIILQSVAKEKIWSGTKLRDRLVMTSDEK